MILDDLQAPSAAEMARASGVSRLAAEEWKSYCNKCRRRLQVLQSRLQRHFPGGTEGRRGLDWGCAVGGVAILLQSEYPLAMHAADVDEHAIRWLRDRAPQIRAEVLPREPVLPWDDAYFDFIYGFSVLTHLPADLQEPYLAELARVSRPGGLVVLTVASYFACRKNETGESGIRIANVDAGELKEKGIIYREYSDKVLGRMDFTRNASYGMTAHSREYIEEVFSRYFDIRDIAEGGLGYQDVITLTVP